MFALFFSLYLAMLQGTWTNYNYNQIFGSGNLNGFIKQGFAEIGTFLTSIFGDNQMNDFGNKLFEGGNIMFCVAFVLSLITCIGIVVMAVKGIKRIFSVFFYGVR